MKPPDQDLGRLWSQLEQMLPPKHHLLLSGPFADGHYSMGIIRNIRPVQQVYGAKGHLEFVVVSLSVWLADHPEGKP